MSNFQVMSFDRASQYSSAVKQTWYTFIQCFEDQGSLGVSSITDPYLGGATQMVLGIMRACYVCWLHPTDNTRT
jgi:hypothetical protein